MSAGRLLRAVRLADRLLALGLLVAIASAAWAQPGSIVGSVTALDGPVRATHHGGTQPHPLRDGATIHEGDRIRTGPEGRVRLALEDGTVLRLGAASELYLDWVLLAPAYDSQNVALELPAGIIRASVTTLLPRALVELRTATASVTVRGTEVVVEATPQATVAVALEGEVAVSSRSSAVPETVVLGAGDGTTIEAGAPPAPPRPWDEARRWVLVQRTAVAGR